MQKQSDDLKREDALFRHLIKSYQDYQNGNTHNLNKIVEEICKKGKDQKQIEMWVELFSRLLIQLSKTNQDPKLVFDIILYQIPWFTSSNHFNALNTFAKILFKILSLHPNQIKPVYHLLISNLQEAKPKSNDYLSKYDIPVQILDITFMNKTLLNDKIQDILHKYPIEIEDKFYNLSSEDQLFMKEIFFFHPQASDKFKNFHEIAVGHFTSKNKSKCFYIIKKDKTHDDISYIKSVENLYDQLFRKRHIDESDEYKEVYLQSIKLIVQIDQIFKLHQNKLIEQIVDQFPHKSRTDQQLKIFVSNILKISEKIVSIQPKVIKLIFQKLLSIDSEIRADQNSKIIIKAQQFRPSDHKDEMLKKLDQLIYILLEFLSKESINLKPISKELHKIFSEVVLPNNNYRMVHYILFYLCSIDQEFQKIFISRQLLNITSESHLCSRNQAIGSIFYLSSLLIRLKNIEKWVYDKTIDCILNHLEQGNNQDELHLQLLQFLAFLFGCQFSYLQNKWERIFSILLKGQEVLAVFSFIQYEIIVKFNEILLKQKLNQDGQKLIEITAGIITRHHSEQTMSSCSQIQSPVKEQQLKINQENDSIWTMKGGIKQRKSCNKYLEFRQPFNNFTLIYCEQFLKPYYKSDLEVIQESEVYLSPKRKQISVPLVKKVKLV